MEENTMKENMDEFDNKFHIRQNGKSSITIRGYTGSAHSLVIPAKINDIPVTVIAKRAFKSCGLTHIDLPHGISYIEEEAFSKNHLEEVVLYPTVSSLSMAAFYKNRIRHLVMPPGLEHIENFCFWNNQLKRLTFPDSLLYLGMLCFGENPLSEISIGFGVTFDSKVEAIPGFDRFYNNNGKKAGHYILNDGRWTYDRPGKN
jgi:hypothetical protein